MIVDSSSALTPTRAPAGSSAFAGACFLAKKTALADHERRQVYVESRLIAAAAIYAFEL